MLSVRKWEDRITRGNLTRCPYCIFTKRTAIAYRADRPEAAPPRNHRKIDMYEVTGKLAIPFYRFGRAIRYRLDELDRWAAARKVEQ